jgi:hypothetical protein
MEGTKYRRKVETNKNKGDIKSGHMYKRYIRHLTPKEIKEGYALSQTEINSAVHEVNRRIMEVIIKENLHFLMPYNLGKISVMMKKMDPITKMDDGKINRPINWKETNKLWADRPELHGKNFIYHTNNHTGGYIAMFKWVKRTGYLKNALSYGFDAVKDASRMVAKELQNPFSKVDYYEIKEKLCLPQNM